MGQAMEYALVNPSDEVTRYSSEYASFDPSVPVKSGYRWLPIETETSFDGNPLMSSETTTVVEPGRVVKRTIGVRRSDAEQKAAVKLEARRRILARFPEWMQTNMVARAVELTRKATLTDEEQAEERTLIASWGWIKSVRNASNEIEQMSPIPLDYNDNSRWPA